MLSKLNITGLDCFKAAVIFFPIIIYPPFFFQQSFPQSIRVGLFLILCCYLFLSSFRYKVRDLILIFSLSLLLIILFSSNTREIPGLFNIGSNILTIIFGWLMYRYLEEKKQRVEVMLKVYSLFFYLAATCSIISLLYFQVAGEYDIFGYGSDRFTYLVTPFGIIYTKFFGSIEVYRSVFFFNEPIHASLFFAANVIIVSPLLNKNSILFKILNLIAGVLLMSLTFYILLIALYFFSKKMSIKSFTIWLLSSIFFTIVLIGFDFINSSSIFDRLSSYEIFFKTLEQATTKQLFFGHGIRGFTLGGFNSGIAISIVEYGFVGFMLLVLILVLLLRLNILIFLFIFLSSLVLDPLKTPFFWFLIILMTVKIRDINKKQVRSGLPI